MLSRICPTRPRTLLRNYVADDALLGSECNASQHLHSTRSLRTRHSLPAIRSRNRFREASATNWISPSARLQTQRRRTATEGIGERGFVFPQSLTLRNSDCEPRRRDRPIISRGQRYLACAPWSRAKPWWRASFARLFPAHAPGGSEAVSQKSKLHVCLLYTSDAADEEDS